MAAPRVGGILCLSKRGFMPDIIRAILLMVISMFFFTLADLFVKLSSHTLPSEVVITVMGGGTMVLFYAAMRLQNLRLAPQ